MVAAGAMAIRQIVMAAANPGGNRGGSCMNIANLQVEGLLLAFASVLRSLVQSGALSEATLKSALSDAEAAGLTDRLRCEQLSPSQRDSLAFAARFLSVATRSETGMRPFSDVAREVGRTT
jgi:hypothetical protein